MQILGICHNKATKVAEFFFVGSKVLSLLVSEGEVNSIIAVSLFHFVVFYFTTEQEAYFALRAAFSPILFINKTCCLTVEHCTYSCNVFTRIYLNS
ncbi:hypothetical protein Ahy_B09g094683 isoform C [Arachis hypogaea]|uniref:Uncharacterized protein n=1 Tax=Arachis hypogaea TaxID=3818 RepID=A0A444XC01_ARAHY|nr:hypothetical protein Ahy_B09g094683 isoform C [Arachis hypogaea]